MVALLVVVAASSGLLLLPQTDDGLLGLPPLEVGDPSPRTVKSPVTLMVADPATTEKLRAQEMAQVPPTYDQLLWMGDTVKARLESAFEAGEVGSDAGPSSGGPRQAEAFVLELGAAVEPAQLDPIIRAENPSELLDAMIMVAQTIYEAPVVADRPYLRLQLEPAGVAVRMVARDRSVEGESTLRALDGVLGMDQARARVDEIVAERLERLPKPQRRAVAAVVKKLLRPNLVPNEAETERRKARRAAGVREAIFVVEPGGVIIDAGEPVNRQHLLMLSKLEEALDTQRRLQSAVGAAVLMVFLVIFSYRVARRSFRPRPRHRDLAFLAASFVGMLLVLWVGYKGALYLTDGLQVLEGQAARYLIPVAVGAMLVRLVAGVEAAAMLSPVVGLAAGWMMDGNLAFAAYGMLGSLAAASAADTESPRSMVWWAGLRVCLAQVVTVVAVDLLSAHFDPQAILQPVLAAIGSGLLSTLAAALLLPVVELLFGFTTAYRLSDLANLNHPLLRELLLEAPGTYHHSMQVGALAEAGAEAIGAHRLLARVGGYYHDLGKVRNPRAFAENDPDGFVGVSPEEQADQLRAHVAAGVEIATEHRLGAPVIEIIASHHGASLVRAAHERALQRSLGPVDEALFRYEGPRPVSREAALVLLADVVEAATRPLGNQMGLTRASIEASVRHAISEVLEDEQLDLCDLTLRDLGAVVVAFTDVLEERLVRRGKPPTLSSLPALPSVPLVRPPPGGEPN